MCFLHFGHLIVYNGCISHIFHLINLTFFLQAFAQLLQAPHDDAQSIIHERFPVPRLVVCDQHGSQVIFLSVALIGGPFL